jgi:hypothetical protein
LSQQSSELSAGASTCCKQSDKEPRHQSITPLNLNRPSVPNSPDSPDSNNQVPHPQHGEGRSSPGASWESYEIPSPHRPVACQIGEKCPVWQLTRWWFDPAAQVGLHSSPFCYVSSSSDLEWALGSSPLRISLSESRLLPYSQIKADPSDLLYFLLQTSTETKK